jgi:hypothetical protein
MIDGIGGFLVPALSDSWSSWLIRHEDQDGQAIFAGFT